MVKNFAFILVATFLFSQTSLAQSVWDSTGTTIYYNGGKVGIGTANPTGHFGIFKTGTIGQGNFNNAYLYVTDGTKNLGLDPNQVYASGELVLSSGSGYIQMQTNGANRLRIHNSGRVGIGNDAVDISGTTLDQLVVGNGSSSQGMVLYHGNTFDAGYAFANTSGALTSRILYRGGADRLDIQHGSTEKVTIESDLVHLIPNTRVSGRLFFGSYSNESVGAIQIKRQGANEGITLWTETGNITKRIWIDDASNTLRITAGANIDNGMSMDEVGHIGIGSDPGTYPLEVNGTIRSKEVIVEATGWPDYVFDPEYELQSLEEIEAHIKTKGHLPEIPSAKEVEEEGQHLGEMQQLLLKKIEELTLHVIELKKQNDAQQKEIERLKEN